MLLGIRNWGHGIIVFDIDDYQFVKRISTDGLTACEQAAQRERNLW